MKSMRKPLMIVLTSLAIGAGSLSMAQDTSGASQAGTGNGQSAQRFQQRMEQRAAELHDKLKLTPAQEPAWQAYVARMRSTMRMQRPNEQEVNQLTAPERMERRLASMRQHEQQLVERIAATKEFYGVLTAEQKKTFDDTLKRGMERRHHRHGMH